MSDFLLNANKLYMAAREQEIVIGADDVRAFCTIYDDIVRKGEALNTDQTGA